MGAPLYKTEEERIFRHVRVSDSGCWEWTAQITKSGYGATNYNGRGAFLAHRLSWMIFRNRNLKLFVLHKCDNRRCVNPDHLFEGTNADNMRDMKGKGRARGLIGEAHNMAKLTENDVRTIRALRESGVTMPKISEQYGVTVQAIFRIVHRLCWKHI